MTPGQKAFEAYNDARGGVNYQGHPTPPWDQLPVPIRKAWEAGAQALLRNEDGLQPRTGDFGWALDQLKFGLRVARTGWNGKGMWLVLVTGESWKLEMSDISSDTVDSLKPFVRLAPFIAMKTADNKLVPWLASQTDMLAEDWEMVE